MCGSLVRANLGASLASDITPRLWSRLAILSCINPLSAILLCPNCELVDCSSSTAIMKGVAHELASVIQAMGINDKAKGSIVTSEGLYNSAISACSQSPGTYSSMAIDVKLGKSTEVDYFTGYVVRRAKEFGIPTPHCSILTELVLAKSRVMAKSGGLQHKDTLYGSWS